MTAHAWANRLQTLLLIATLLGISALAGALLLGEDGFWIAVFGSVLALLLEPGAASWLTLRLYRAQPLPPAMAPELWRILEHLAARAALPAVPTPYYVPSPMVNAFAVGDRKRSAIALTDGLLRGLSSREITGVLAHEMAHIAHGDLRVMGLADYVSRLTSVFALAGLLVAFFALPTLLVMDVGINWSGLLLLAVAPHIALLVQLGLSRVREFDADRKAAELTGDPDGLAAALAHIEAVSRSWRRLLLPGWGNPEPSWLRTHPATDERIRRLRSQPAPTPACDASTPMWHGTDTPARVRQPPRWRIGGFWW